MTTVNGLKYGVEPTQSGPFVAGPAETPMTYGGGPVVHSNATYVVYWDPSNTYLPQWQAELSGLLQGVGSEDEPFDVFRVAAQYGEPVEHKVGFQSSFHGAYTDVTAFPTTENCSDPGSPCLTDAQIRTQLSEYIADRGLPTGLNPSSGVTPIYFVFTPPGVTVCLQGAGQNGNCSDAGSANQLCSYHSYIPADPSKGTSTVLYAVEPWDPISECQNGSGTLEEPNKIPADVIVNGVADQQIATLTDPLFTAWHDTGTDEDETPDKCRNEFLPLPPGSSANQSIDGTDYYINDEFNQAGLYNTYVPTVCVNEVTLTPKFTATNPVKNDEQVTFNATESEATLGIAKYKWSFGDGAGAEVNCQTHTPTDRYKPSECDDLFSGIGDPNSVASVVHTYSYGGVYQVTLTITDDSGGVSSVTEPITVDGPEPPPPPSPSPSGSAASSTQTGSSASSTGTSAQPGATKPSLPSPVAAQAVTPTSVGKATRKGLVVRYQVNEQVTGSFNVLLAASVARRIGLHMPLAYGLPAGTPPQEIVGRALLVTTRGGRGTIKIKFGPTTGARLRRLHHVSLMLQLNLRNAAGGATTVLSKLTLR